MNCSKVIEEKASYFSEKQKDGEEDIKTPNTNQESSIN